VNNIPSEFERFRISVKERCELVELICNKIIKLEEYFINVKKMRSSKTKKGSGDKGKDKDKDKDEFSAKKEIKVKGLHIIKNELEFAVQVMILMTLMTLMTLMILMILMMYFFQSNYYYSNNYHSA
jgi:hypothetical protein